VQMPPPPPPAPPLSSLALPGLPLGGPASGPSSPGTPGSAPTTAAQGANAPPQQAVGSTQGTSPSTTNSATGASPGVAGNAAGANATLAPMPNPKPPGSTAVTVTSSLRPSGLFGTENYLQIDVLQPSVVRSEAEPGERPLPGAKRGTRAPELRTVVYTFEEGRDPQRPAGEAHTYLARRELDWELAHAAQRAASRQPSGPFSPPGGADAGTASEPISPELRAEGAHDESSAVVPEVAQFGMRYFDGSQWFKEWDSAARKALPLAIEVAVQLRAFDEPEQPAHHLVNDPASEDAKAMPPQLPIYRLVIHLPSATEPTGGGGPSQMVTVGGRGGAERPLGAETNGARR
jgi:hypothetical protein